MRTRRPRPARRSTTRDDGGVAQPVGLPRVHALGRQLPRVPGREVDDPGRPPLVVPGRRLDDRRPARGSSAASAARSPTVPEPIPSACSACSPGDDEERGDRAVTARSLQLGKAGRARGAAAGSPIGPSTARPPARTAPAGGGCRCRRGTRAAARRATSVDLPRRRRRRSPATADRRRPPITCSSAWPRPSSASVTWRIVATRVPSGDTSAVETIEVDPTRRPTRSW